MVFNPMPSEKLKARDVIVVIGKREDLVRMSEIL
jgi:K+/H+ antiporter YhaU regulatory subunit KhtT